MASSGPAVDYRARCDLRLIDFLQLLDEKEQEVPDIKFPLHHLRRHKDAESQLLAAPVRRQGHSIETGLGLKAA